MTQPIIQVEQLSKAYRIGLEEKKSETLAGVIIQTLKSPFQNFKNISNLRDFRKEEESIFWALKDVSFEVNQGEVLGIIGHNGAGKSTLLKILSRITEPTSGRVRIHGRVSSLLEVGTGFHPDLSGRENIYLNGTILGMTKREIDSKLEEIIEFSGVSKYIDTPVKRYSSGMTVRLAFAVAAHLEPEILIIDEVLAVGDAEFQKKCLGKMKSVSKQGRTVIFVSHNLGAVRSLCTKGILLKAGTVIFNGNIQDTIQGYVSKKDRSLLHKGTIVEEMRTIHHGFAKVKQVILVDEYGNSREDFFYQEDISVSIKLEIIHEIADALLDIRIISEESVVIEHILNSILGGKPITLQPGSKEFLVKVKNRLAPGSYSINVGVHASAGNTLEYVEDVYSFTVLKASQEDELSYAHEFVDGYVHQKGEWQQLN